jgi:uncharacterized membrane protein
VVALLLAYIVHPRFPLFYWLHTLPLYILLIAGVLVRWQGRMTAQGRWSARYTLTLVFVVALVWVNLAVNQHNNPRVAEAKVQAGNIIAEMYPSRWQAQRSGQCRFHRPSPDIF